MNILKWIVAIAWIAFFVYWTVSAIGKKKVIRRTSLSWRFGFTILFVVGIFWLSSGSYASDQIFPNTPLLAGIGALLCAAGIAFAIWARRHLGRNWNGTPSIQQDHQLVTSGPYRFVRHPIYTGILTALIGSALVSDSLVWLFACLAAAVMFIWRVHVEEQFMQEIFSEQYPAYKKQTKALIPFVW